MTTNNHPAESAGEAGELKTDATTKDEGDHDWNYYDDYTECANCGGEGFTYGCSWDWQCDTYDEGEGNCLCTRRCEWCNPLTATELAEQRKLQSVLSDALRDTQP